MTRNQPPSAAEERAALETMRSAGRLLLQSADLLLKPQYVHLIKRIEALIAIHDSASTEEDGV